MTNAPYIIPGGPYWVRWRDSAYGHSPWRQCVDVAITDGWLICHTAVGPDILVPAHTIRGTVEMTKENPET